MHSKGVSGTPSIDPEFWWYCTMTSEKNWSSPLPSPPPHNHLRSSIFYCCGRYKAVVGAASKPFKTPQSRPRCSVYCHVKFKLFLWQLSHEWTEITVLPFSILFSWFYALKSFNNLKGTTNVEQVYWELVFA